MFCEKCGGKLTEDSKFCESCGNEILESSPREFTPDDTVSNYQDKQGSKYDKKALIIFFSILVVIILVFVFSDSSNTSNTESKTGTSQNNVSIKPVSQQNNNKDGGYSKISESVVNILCPYANEPFSIDSSGTGGSGTILDESGLVISNSHIIPQDKDSLNISENGCFVILPDATTGAPKEIYVATPTVLNELSDEYDLAFLTIYDVYADKDGYKYGTYPRKFPVFDDTGLCNDEQIELGESVRVFGYPVSSGGYNLTITDGIVSSFSDDNLVLTSAKIDQGNSGGLAVDGNGCMLGIPSAVSEGEYDKLGIIIPASTIADFIKEAEKKINSE